jgi:segregation and condensation protein B
MELKRIVEAILFASNKPKSVSELVTLIKKGAEGRPVGEVGKVTPKTVEAALEQVRSDHAESSFELKEVAGGFRFASKSDYASWVSLLFNETKPPKLTQAGLETLAIIAYRQPISRAEIEAVRGVGVGGVIDTLIERNVVRIGGRADLPGRPLLYETTDYFLEHFGLRGIDDLPNVEELRRAKMPPPADEDAAKQQELLPDSDAESSADAEPVEESAEAVPENDGDSEPREESVETEVVAEREKESS